MQGADRTSTLLLNRVRKQQMIVRHDQPRGARRLESGGNSPWAVEREVDDIEAIIDAAGGTACLCGHSSGAVLALEAALRLGHKVERALMYDPPYVHDESERAEYRRISGRIDALLDEGDHGKAMRTFLRSIGMPKVFVSLLPVVPRLGHDEGARPDAQVRHRPHLRPPAA